MPPTFPVRFGRLLTNTMSVESQIHNWTAPPDVWMQDAGGARFVRTCLEDRVLPTTSSGEAGEIVVFAIHRSIWSAGAEAHRRYLTDEERERAERYRHAEDRNRFIMGRAVLRLIASAAEGTAAPEVAIRPSRYGRPEMEGSTLSVNVSHSGAWVLVAAGDALSVGVDVEQRSPDVDVDGVSEAVFSEWERETLLQYPHSEQVEYFFDIWARKEACIKADGRGIQFGLQRFDVEFRPGYRACIRDVRGDENGRSGPFHLCPIHLDDDHAAALCYTGAERPMTVITSR